MKNRTGRIVFGDASLYVWENPEKCNDEYRNYFRKNVFKKIAGKLLELGFTLSVPADKVIDYGESFARNFRVGYKGFLLCELSIQGRCIELKMWQSIANITRKYGNGYYEFDKEEKMPYLIRLSMELTRRKIRDHLLSLFEGYTLKEPDKKVGPGGLTAVEWIDKKYSESCHLDKSIGRPGGEENCRNNVSAEGEIIKHGSKVYALDHKGRWIYGTAMYNINNMWWVVTGKYDYRNICASSIYTLYPGTCNGNGFLRYKRNAKIRHDRLKKELKTAVDQCNFERAIILRDILRNEDLDGKLYG